MCSGPGQVRDCWSWLGGQQVDGYVDQTYRRKGPLAKKKVCIPLGETQSWRVACTSCWSWQQRLRVPVSTQAANVWPLTTTPIPGSPQMCLLTRLISPPPPNSCSGFWSRSYMRSRSSLFLPCAVAPSMPACSELHFFRFSIVHNHPLFISHFKHVYLSAPKLFKVFHRRSPCHLLSVSLTLTGNPKS